MKRIIIYIVTNLYLFLTLLAITTMFGLYDWYSLIVLVVICSFFICFKKIRWKPIDSFVLFFLVYSLFSFFFSNYSFALFYYGIKVQIVSLLFYFLARSKYFQDNLFIDRAKPIFTFIFISAIVLYFFPPAWYTAYKTSNLPDGISSKMFFELTRMSAFWPASYFVGTSSIVSIIYISEKIFIKQEINKKNIAFLFLALICLFFSQQRVALAYCMLFMLILTLMTYIYRLKTRKILLRFWLVLLFIIGLIYYIVINYMPAEFVDYVLNRTINEEDGLIKERILLFEDFFKYMSLLGYGLGRFGHNALIYDMPSITDCEYLRIICELGYIGLTVFLIIYFSILYKGFKTIKNNFFEFFCLGYYLAAMIGATPLEAISQHSFLIWYSLGHIVSKSVKVKYK